MDHSHYNLTGEASGIEVIQDPYQIQRLYNNLVQSAEQEILLFLPTTSAFLREEKLGILSSLQRAAGRDVRVRIITPSDEKIEARLHAIFEGNSEMLQLRRIRSKSGETSVHKARTKILVIDRKEYLIVELRDDSKQTFVEAVRLAIYSNTESTVVSYMTLFESLWDQAELYEQLEAHDKLQKEFINIAAHELRTPIQPILGVAELLEGTSKDKMGDRKINDLEFEILLRNSKRLERLSSNILEVSRIESNSFRLDKEEFDMNNKIKNVISDFDLSKLPGKNLAIRFKPAPRPLLVEADKTRIFEVLSNLVRNSIKFTNGGTIDIEAYEKDNEICVVVRDTGKGIDPEIMTKLFDKFVSRSEQGTGLGLYLAKSIVEAHGGRIWAENNKNGNGATFTFTLPAKI